MTFGEGLFLVQSHAKYNDIALLGKAMSGKEDPEDVKLPSKDKISLMKARNKYVRKFKQGVPQGVTMDQILDSVERGVALN